jgi:hypothetical protein
LLATHAFAQRIVLLRPTSSDPAILSAFAHLQGELTVHDFEVVVIDSNSGATADALEQVAEREGAVAAISLLRSRDVATADIWVSDRVTGKTSRRTISTPPNSEGPSVLAVRAVDLLRASLREYGPSPKPPLDVIGAAPSGAPAHVLDWAEAAAAPAPTRFALEAGVAMQTAPSGFRPAYGPSIAVGYDPARTLALRLVFQGPLWGARYTTENASAMLLQEQLMAEVRWRFLDRSALSCAALGVVGVHHLSVQGEATAPYDPKRDAAWTGLAGVGLATEWRFAPGAALSLRARCLALAPKPVVNVGADQVDFGRPLFQMTGGLDVSF